MYASEFEKAWRKVDPQRSPKFELIPTRNKQAYYSAYLGVMFAQFIRSQSSHSGNRRHFRGDDCYDCQGMANFTRVGKNPDLVVFTKVAHSSIFHVENYAVAVSTFGDNWLYYDSVFFSGIYCNWWSTQLVGQSSGLVTYSIASPIYGMGRLVRMFTHRTNYLD